ncbi:MAG: NYN domain-containing protein [Clostridia bacterium]|nr:NYN domain-containing protein [Clostridia bacterium]
MPPKLLIIDGFNVIRNSARYKSDQKDYESETIWNSPRQKLVNDASLFASGSFEKCIIVFDAALTDDRDDKITQVANVEIAFSPKNKTADDIIEALCLKNRDIYEIVVVSNDSTIKDTVFGHGVSTMSSESFAMNAGAATDELKNTTTTSGTGARKTLGDNLDPETLNKLREMMGKQ